MADPVFDRIWTISQELKTGGAGPFTFRSGEPDPRIPVLSGGDIRTYAPDTQDARRQGNAVDRPSPLPIIELKAFFLDNQYKLGAAEPENFPLYSRLQLCVASGLAFAREAIAQAVPYASQISSRLNIGDTTMTVDPALAMAPTEQIVIGSERIRLDSTTDNGYTWTVTRARNSTAEENHAPGSVVMPFDNSANITTQAWPNPSDIRPTFWPGDFREAVGQGLTQAEWGECRALLDVLDENTDIDTLGNSFSQMLNGAENCGVLSNSQKNEVLGKRNNRISRADEILTGTWRNGDVEQARKENP